MIKLDVDADASTTSSSMARLTVPAGGTVLYAGLYWGAGTTAGTGGVAAPTNGDRSLLFKTPGASTYTRMQPQVLDRLTTFWPTTTASFYNVTNIVKAAGSGDYWGADIQAGTGRDRYGAWSLVVAYADPTAPSAGPLGLQRLRDRHRHRDGGRDHLRLPDPADRAGPRQGRHGHLRGRPADHRRLLHRSTASACPTPAARPTTSSAAG